jgi:N-acetylmuramoyl-L-alanine amidase
MLRRTTATLLTRLLALVRQAAFLGIAFACGAPAFAAPEGYVPLGSLALRLRLGFERQNGTNVVICEGNGMRITAAPGLTLMLLNGEGIALDQPVLEENGVVYVPPEAAEEISARSARRTPAAVVASPAARPGSLAATPAPHPVTRTIPCAPPGSTRAAGPVRPPVHPFTIMIDPGHGGDHSGAKGRTGLMEKAVNLDVARRLQRHLEAAGARVLLTRTSDAHLAPEVRDDLQRRYEISNRSVPDLFLSIHSNWAEDSSARGFEVFVRRERASDDTEKRSDASRIRIPAERLGGVPLSDPAIERMLHDVVIDRSAEGSLFVAREIERRFAASLQTENRGIKERDFQVVRWSHAPAVLVELEFLSNARAERELGSPEHRELLAKQLADAVAAFRARWAPGSLPPDPGERTGLAARRSAYAVR